MKKLTAFILICILAFNWFGYRIVAELMQHNSDAKLEACVNGDLYENSVLVELKIPLNLPYQINRATYERYNGDVEYKGVDYKYIKRKICNDTLYLQCIRNNSKAVIETAKNNFFKNSIDISSKDNKAGNKNAAIKKLMQECDDHCFAFAPRQSFSTLTGTRFNGKSIYLPVFFQEYKGKPPRTMSDMFS